jgi:hypothetical protein
VRERLRNGPAARAGADDDEVVIVFHSGIGELYRIPHL